MDKKQEDEKIYFDDILYYYDKLLYKKFKNIFKNIFNKELENKIDDFEFLLSKNNLYNDKKFTLLINNIKLLNAQLLYFIKDIMNSDIEKKVYIDNFHNIIQIINQNIYYCNIQIQSKQSPQFQRKLSIAEQGHNIYKEKHVEHLNKENLQLLDKSKVAKKVAIPQHDEQIPYVVEHIYGKPPIVIKDKNEIVNYLIMKKNADNFKINAKVGVRNMPGIEEEEEKLSSPSSPSNPPPTRNPPNPPTPLNPPTSPTPLNPPTSPNPQLLQNGSQRNLVLINVIGDGDCFINAIFDYGLYTNKLEKIYDKLNYIETKIYSDQKYTTHIIYKKYVLNIQNSFNKKNIKRYHKNIIDIINEKSLYLIIPIDHKYTDRINIRKYYSHLDSSKRPPLYDVYRSNFIKFMKYIWAIYSLTIHFDNLKSKFREIYFPKDISQQYNKELIKYYLPTELATYIIKTYYSNDNLIIDNNDDDNTYNNLTIEYILYFFLKKNIYSSHIEISIFTKIFMEPITDENYKKDTNYITDPSFNGDKFFIDHKKLIELKNDDIYKKTYKTNKKEHNISVINENEDHFLLCLYEDEMIYHFDNNGEITSGLILL